MFSTKALVLCSAFLALMPAVSAADSLRMRDGISFVHDLDQGFPILAERMDDVDVTSGHPTVLFFAAAGDLNSNRQAKRIVEVYKKYKLTTVKFVVIDVDKPANATAKQLIKAHYQGYIPCEVVFDKQAKPIWTKTGEVEAGVISAQIDKALQ